MLFAIFVCLNFSTKMNSKKPTGNNLVAVVIASRHLQPRVIASRHLQPKIQTKANDDQAAVVKPTSAPKLKQSTKSLTALPQKLTSKSLDDSLLLVHAQYLQVRLLKKQACASFVRQSKNANVPIN